MRYFLELCFMWVLIKTAAGNSDLTLLILYPILKNLECNTRNMETGIYKSHILFYYYYISFKICKKI